MLLGLTRVWLPLCASCCIFSQTAPPAFEAASIKLNTTGSTSGGSKGSEGQVVFTNVPLRRLILRAYGIQDFELVGPDWMANVRFDIAAKYPADSTSEQRPLMLQNLLAERFHLAVHRTTKEMPAYALVVAKNGPKLGASKEGGNSTNSTRGRFEDKAVSMAGLAKQLEEVLEHPVGDKTGLTGVYTLKLEWTPDEQPGSPAEQPLGPSIAIALQEQLGLKLQTQKLPMEIIVVDRVDRTPVEN
jgi:uncharacterized protein (TIGR03435 family)